MLIKLSTNAKRHNWTVDEALSDFRTASHCTSQSVSNISVDFECIYFSFLSAFLAIFLPFGFHFGLTFPLHFSASTTFALLYIIRAFSILSQRIRKSNIFDSKRILCFPPSYMHSAMKYLHSTLLTAQNLFAARILHENLKRSFSAIHVCLIVVVHFILPEWRSTLVNCIWWGHQRLLWTLHHVSGQNSSGNASLWFMHLISERKLLCCKIGSIFYSCRNLEIKQCRTNRVFIAATVGICMEHIFHFMRNLSYNPRIVSWNTKNYQIIMERRHRQCAARCSPYLDRPQIYWVQAH